MTVTFDEDLILPVVTAIVTVAFVIGYQTLVPKSEVDYYIQENAILFQEVSSANRELTEVTKELDKYKVSQKSLEYLGASPMDARRAMMASQVYGLDVKALGALATSECHWQTKPHPLPYVVGKMAINLKANPDPPYNVHNPMGNMLTGAHYLRQYLDIYGTYTKAFARYKGYSPLGFQQALGVQNIRSTM